MAGALDEKSIKKQRHMDPYRKELVKTIHCWNRTLSKEPPWETMVLPASPPPLHPFVKALTDKSEQGFWDVSWFLHQIGSANLPIIANAENFNVNTAGVTVGFILQLSYQYFGQLIKFDIVGKSDGGFPDFGFCWIMGQSWMSFMNPMAWRHCTLLYMRIVLWGL